MIPSGPGVPPCGSNPPEDPGASLGDISRLVAQHRPALYGFVFAAVRNHHDAEDLLQDVCQAIVHSRSQFQPGTNFGAWAREIARRRILEFARKRGRSHHFVRSETLDALADAAARVETEEPFDAYRGALQECLKKLQGLLAQVVLLRYGERLEVARIAEQTGKTLQATYALLKRARAALRECVDRSVGGPRPPIGKENS